MQLKLKQDEERKSLVTSKDKIREAMGMLGGKLQGPTQVDPSLCTGMTDKSGYLGKKPENTLRLPRRQWPKRYCTVSMQGFTMANSHVSPSRERGGVKWMLSLSLPHRIITPK